jgi:DNA-binding CsgD family transcriptional regulator
MKLTDKERFLNKIRITVSGCWEWKGASSPKGYGKFRYNGTTYQAHRVSYELFVAPLIDGLVIMHSCDNPGCVNPEHLRQGTKVENMQDCISKGRFSMGEAHSKYSDEQVKFAVESLLTQKEVAGILGCTQSYVSELRRGVKRNYLGLKTRHKIIRKLTNDEKLMILSLGASCHKVAEFLSCPYSAVQQLRAKYAANPSALCI